MSDLTENSEDLLVNEFLTHSKNSHIESHEVAGFTLRPYCLQTRELLLENPLIYSSDIDVSDVPALMVAQFIFIHLRIRWIEFLPLARIIYNVLFYLVLLKVNIYGVEKAKQEIVEIIKLVNTEVNESIPREGISVVNHFDFSHKVEFISFVMSHSNLTRRECEWMYLGEFYQYYRACMRTALGQNEYYKSIVTEYDRIRKVENKKLAEELNNEQ